MKYLIIGAGGTGGLIGGFLARKGLDVTLVARGEHLAVIQQNGLTITPYKEPEFTIPVKAVDQADSKGKYDVIFVCVKAYSIGNIIPLLQETCFEKTVVIPVLNAMTAGEQLRRALPGITIFDGCIYIAGNIAEPGKIIQSGKIFKIVYGPSGDTRVNKQILEELEEDLRSSGIDVLYTTNIKGEIFKKLSFTSPFAATAIYYNIKASDIQVAGKYREQFIQLLKELIYIAQTADLGLTTDLVKNNLTILDGLSGDFTTSIQKDIAQGKPDEREQLIFDIVRIAEEYGVNVPQYLKIAEHLGYKKKDKE